MPANLSEQAARLLDTCSLPATLTVYDEDGRVAFQEEIWFCREEDRVRAMTPLNSIPSGCVGSFCLETARGSLCLLGELQCDRDRRRLFETVDRLCSRFGGMEIIQGADLEKARSTVWLLPEVVHMEPALAVGA